MISRPRAALNAAPAIDAPPRFGIIPKVILAFGFAFIVSLVGFLHVDHEFRRAGDGLSEISETYLPALSRVTELTHDAHRLVAFTVDMLLPRTELMREEPSKQIAAVLAEKERLIEDLRASGALEAELTNLEQHFDALTQKLPRLARLNGKKVVSERKAMDQAERLRHLSVLIGRLDEGQGQGVGCLERWKSAARRSITELLATRGALDTGYLQLRQRAFIETSQQMQQAAVCVPAGTAPALGRLEAEIRSFGGADGLVELHRMRIELSHSLTAALGRIRWLEDTLREDVTTLVQGVRARTDRHRAEMESMIRECMAVLTLILALLLAIALGICLYLYRALLHPILGLHKAIADSLSGCEACFPNAGHNEVGVVMSAVRTFIATSQRRENDLRSAKTTAERANRNKSLFLAKINHELRTPLNTILGYADLLRQTSGLTDEDHERCGIVRRSATHLKHLVDDLRDIAAIESDRLKPIVADIDLGKLIGDIETSVHQEAKAKGLAFRSEQGAGLPFHILTDGRRLRQVLLNLLNNAVKYTESGAVVLRADAIAGDQDRIRLRFEVEDTGPGIAPEERERLFAPFEQLRPGQPGSGLGLAISHELTTLMGGTLELDSTQCGGSLFRVELPVRTKLAESPAKEHLITGYSGPRRRILVVDDEAASRRLLYDFLIPLGFAVDRADGAPAALELLRQGIPDLVLMDLVMPGWCGYATSHALREDTGRPDLPVIAVSASPLQSQDEPYELGLNAYITKPFERRVLLDAIGRCLELCWVYSEGSIGFGGNEPAFPARQGPDAEPSLNDLSWDRENDPEPPAQIELETVRELARMGALEMVLDWCDDLATGQPKYAPFAQRIRVLAAHSTPNRLLIWLQTARA